MSAQVLAEVHAMNERADIDGIVVQMPLPTGVDCKKVPVYPKLRVSPLTNYRVTCRATLPANAVLLLARFISDFFAARCRP